MIRISIILLALALAGCTSTVTPSIVQPAQASYSGNERNSGIISRESSGYLVDGVFRARYNALIRIYGDDFTIPIKPDDGISLISDASAPEAERWLIDFRHFELMLRMNVKRNSGIAPKTR